jgi:predicted XRE-type DNA-binding protein
VKILNWLDSDSRELQGKHHMTKRKVHSVFHDLYPEDQAAEMEMRSLLLQGLSSWLAESGMTQTEAAKVLAVTQARVSDIKRGKISSFSLDLLVRLAARAGLNPKLKLVA